jgi:DNA-binding PadR family transcriptional regulator
VITKPAGTTKPDVDPFLPLPVAWFQILVSIADRDRHGYAIMQDVASRTDGKLRLGPGTLYGAVKRMLEAGLIEEGAEPRNTGSPGSLGSNDERRRYYHITPLGRRVAAEESARLAKLLRQVRATGLVPKNV